MSSACRRATANAAPPTRGAVTDAHLECARGLRRTSVFRRHQGVVVRKFSAPPRPAFALCVAPENLLAQDTFGLKNPFGRRDQGRLQEAWRAQVLSTRPVGCAKFWLPQGPEDQSVQKPWCPQTASCVRLGVSWRWAPARGSVNRSAPSEASSRRYHFLHRPSFPKGVPFSQKRACPKRTLGQRALFP